MKNAILLLSTLFLIGANCSQNSPVLSPQLEHIASAVMVPCDPYLAPEGKTPLSTRTCLAAVNPLRQRISVFDMSQLEWVIGPTGYSALAVRAKGYATALVAYQNADEGYVFMLDAHSSTLRAVRTRSAGNTVETLAAPFPELALDNRPVKTFVLNPNGPANPEIFAVFSNGTTVTTTFDLATRTFSVPTTSAPVNGLVVDAVYDVASGATAFMLVNGTQNDVVIRPAKAATPTHTLNDVGNVKVAIGEIATTPAPTLHLLFMNQDTPTMRVIGLNTATLQPQGVDNNLTLASSVVAAYFPMGENQATENGEKDWLAVSSDSGHFYYLHAAHLAKQDTATKPIAASVNLGRLFNMPGAFSGLKQILGGDVRILSGEEATKDRAVCSRQMIFVFTSGSVASICEGNAGGPVLLVNRNPVQGT